MDGLVWVPDSGLATPDGCGTVCREVKLSCQDGQDPRRGQAIFQMLLQALEVASVRDAGVRAVPGWLSPLLVRLMLTGTAWRAAFFVGYITLICHDSACA